MQAPQQGQYCGRFAPSPTGPLHIGSLLAAVASFLDARAAGGRWLLRIEDIDPPREVPGASDAIIASLQRHGLSWDGDILWQSSRIDAYRDALATLRQRGLIFDCSCTRATLGPGGSCAGRCRPGPGDACAQRLRIVEALQDVDDRFLGPQRCQDMDDLPTSDITLWRKDGLPAYQLAVCVDDSWQGVNAVVRGSDLLSQSPVQAYLLTALGCPVPSYAHLPLILGEDGRKLSKQNGARAINDERPLANLRQVLALLGQESAQAEAATPEQLLACATERWTPALPPAGASPLVYADATNTP